MNNKNIRKRPSPLDDAEDDGKDTKTGSYMSHNGKRLAISDNRLYFLTGTSEHMDSKNVLFQCESSKEIQVQNDSKVTATLETETDFSRDARAIQERALKKAEEALEGKNKTSGDVKLYKGINSYTDYRAGLHHQQTLAAEKASGDYGPLRASVHVRVSAGFDYQPDICKDYKETGYCGYGDS
ncbi:hypothetical protein BVRB_011650 [Beta vulgaris subsp. vulgaris]|uniref:C3H1-type domain-containing protein n=1 Tax=Beta vulgaris subsp. vulgaris TaxID=3555 RepID=A0A0J8B5K1_BETVV|nr:hypothetical protein BVRB_011650 [Beta vulgaris subsp. vulgaris]